MAVEEHTSCVTQAKRTQAMMGAALAVLVVLAAVLRAIALDRQLWFDEILTLVNSVRRPFLDIVTTFPSDNQHTLYSILARCSVLLFGEHAWALRLPAAVFGVASIPALYFLGREITSTRESLIACLLLTVSYHHVWFSQDARGYTASLFFTLVSTTLFLVGMRERRTGVWAAYGVATALGAYSQPVTAAVLVAHGVVWLWLTLARPGGHGEKVQAHARMLAALMFAGLLTLLLYAPLLGQATRQLREHTLVPSEWNILWTAREFLTGMARGMRGGTLVIAAGVTLVGLVSYWRTKPLVVALMVLPGVVIVGTISAVGGDIYPRLFFLSIGFAFLLVARGVRSLSELAARLARTNARLAPGLEAAMIAVLTAGSLWALPAAYRPKQDFLGAARFVESARRPGEPIIAVGMAVLYASYHHRDWQVVNTREHLDHVLSCDRRVWLVYTMPNELLGKHAELWQKIKSTFTTVRRFTGSLHGGEVYVSEAERPCP